VEKGGLHVQGVMGFADRLVMTGCVAGVVVPVLSIIIGRWPGFQPMTRSMNKGDVFFPAAFKASGKHCSL
jgi:hypothetical protein